MITISEHLITKWTYGNATLKIVADNQFINADGDTIAAGLENAQVFDCTAEDDSLTIPLISVSPTSDPANTPSNSRYTGYLCDANGDIKLTWFANFVFPYQQSSTDWRNIFLYNGANQVLVSSTDGYTREEFENRIANLVFEADTGTRGTTILSAGTGNDGAVGVLDPVFQAASLRKYLSQYVSLSSALSSIGSTAKTELVIDTDLTVSANTTITKNISLTFYGNKKITVNSGVVLSIENGAGLEADPTQHIFAGAGKPYFTDSIPARLYPEWFGAKGDNATDDSAAFAKLYATYPPSKSATFFLNTGKTYYQGTTPFEPDAPFHLTTEAGADNWYPAASMKWAANTSGVIVHHISTKTGTVTSAQALFSRISNIGVIGEAGGANTHTVNISGLVVTKTAGQDFTSANGYAAGMTVHINNFPYVIASVDSATQITLKPPRLYLDVTHGTTAVTIGDYNSWAITGEWVGQTIDIDGTDYTISNVFYSGAYKMTLSAPYLGSTNQIGGASATFSSVNTGADTITATAHPFSTGQKIYLYNGGTLPSPFTQDYYYIIKIDANTVKLATTYANAMAGTAIDITTSGSGTHTLATTRFAGDATLNSVAATSALGARFNIFHGITLKAPAFVENNKIWYFAGNGISMDSATGLFAPSLSGSAPNCNNSNITRNSLYYNYGNGIYTKGINSNQCSLVNNDCTNNHGAGIYEASFLGNNYCGNHTSFNYFGATYGEGEANNSSFFGEYSEGGQPSSRFAQYMMLFSGVQGAGFATDSQHGYFRAEQGLIRTDNLLVQRANPNPKAVGVALSPIIQQNTMLGFGAAEFANNLSSGGTINSLRYFEYQIGYDQWRTGWYHFYQGGLYYDSTKTLMAFSGTEAAEAEGILAFPTGFRTGYNDSHITKILRGTVTINPASVSANSVSTQTFTLTGASVGDNLVLNVPSAGLTSGLLVTQAFVSATDTVKIVFYNTTASPIDEASATWSYLLIR